MNTAGNYIASSKLTKWLNREFFLKGLSSPFGIGLLACIAFTIGFLASHNLAVIAFASVGAVAAIIVIYYCFFEPVTGYFITTFISFFAFYPNHILNIILPIPTFVELLILIVFFGSYNAAKKLNLPRNSILLTGVSVVFIIYTIFNIVEFFNPDMQSQGGWLFRFKRYMVFVLVYIVSYRLIDTPQRFRNFMKFWLYMSFIAAAYGCYQQWFGMLPMEMTYIKSDPIEYKLMFQGGMLRVFSFLSDVVSFGVLSGSTAVVALIMAINEKQKKRKYLLYFGTIIMTLGMFYSGTRTTTVILPAGMALYLFMTIRSKTTIITLFVSALIAFFILYIPVDNPVLNRVRSSFNTQDASLNVRDVNRHYIQPYIYAHPIGGGIATTGTEGLYYNPNHILAGFPPDSGMLKAALEMGWIGLALTMLFYLVILYQCIDYYFRIKNPEYKTYVVAIAASLFAMIVTQYAQVAIGQIPGAIFFFGTISMIRRLLEFDQAERVISNNM
ncbi:MAG TPA: O-antigen ligase family protein [Chitinophagaceae bacterium]|nr:O-antigen ligase family protein [Chitinophagaceae bacterium]